MTIPFASYGEFIEIEDGKSEIETERKAEREEVYRTVAPWRPHFRASNFRHRVEITNAPSWTLVVTGPKSNEWGFWQGQEFVHNRDWQN